MSPDRFTPEERADLLAALDELWREEPFVRPVIYDRDRLAAMIYENSGVWLTTVDGSPNAASYAIADRLLQELGRPMGEQSAVGLRQWHSELGRWVYPDEPEYDRDEDTT